MNYLKTQTSSRMSIKLTTLIVALFISTLSAVAGNGTGISEAISKQLSIPKELKSNKLNEKVNVQFKIAEDGKATIMNVETSNPELKKYVMKQFPKIDFNSYSAKPEAIYFVDINFKVL